MIGPFLLALLLWMVPTRIAAQTNQSFQVTPEEARPTVGDSVTLQFSVRLDERDLLLDTIPRPVGPIGSGVRVLSVEKMVRTPDRIFHGRARLAFYRPGRQAVPVFGVPFMRVVEGLKQGTLVSDSAFVDVIAVLPAGNPALKDIREPIRNGQSRWLGLLVGALLLAGGLVMLRRRHRRAGPSGTSVEVYQPASPPQMGPYATAVESLSRIERAQWLARGEIARYYQEVVDVLRDYLEQAEAVRARERTTGEVVWALPPHLSESGLRERLHEVLEEADLVKFARYRPGASDAHRFFERSRSLLAQWHEASALNQPADALR